MSRETIQGLLQGLVDADHLGDLLDDGQAVQVVLKDSSVVSIELDGEVEGESTLVLYGILGDAPIVPEEMGQYLRHALELNQPGMLPTGRMAVHDNEVMLVSEVATASLDAAAFRREFELFAATAAAAREDLSAYAREAAQDAGVSGPASPIAPANPAQGWIMA